VVDVDVRNGEFLIQRDELIVTYGRER